MHIKHKKKSFIIFSARRIIDEIRSLFNFIPEELYAMLLFNFTQPSHQLTFRSIYEFTTDNDIHPEFASFQNENSKIRNELKSFEVQNNDKRLI